ncbi:hypothetical protein YSY43_01620 [Paenibacillus sp. YSY-4.3]
MEAQQTAQAQKAWLEQDKKPDEDREASVGTEPVEYGSRRMASHEYFACASA